MSPSSKYFPLRWESTGDQWWFASPIDWAIANGHYDLVRELLRLDGNHLIKLTSLRRIRRLETVWDDEAQFDDVAKRRSQVARRLLIECENEKGKESLIGGGGCGGWLLYTAASAGDLSFVQELLQRDPLLVFGEGEYGVTDILYAAARSKNSHVFRLLYDYALSPRFSAEMEEHVCDVPSAYKWEITNRAIHAAARGGNLVFLKEILSDSCHPVLAYRDTLGATILHAAAARGQVEVVKDLIRSYGDMIISSTDNHGNTALHIAAARGQIAIVESLIVASPSLIYSTNNAGETFLHAAVTGFQTPCFRRLDRQIELMISLVGGRVFNVEEIVNTRNNEGRTALHLAIISNIHYELVELLMSVRYMDVNTRDKDGMTPLDILKQRPRSESSERITRKLISAGGIFNEAARRVVASHIKMQSMVGGSPGTSFRISDPEILMFTSGHKGCLNTISAPAAIEEEKFVVSAGNKPAPAKQATTQRLKRLFLQWPKIKKRDARSKLAVKKNSRGGGQRSSFDSGTITTPIPLRQRFSKKTPSDLCLRSNHHHILPGSPTITLAAAAAKKRFAVAAAASSSSGMIAKDAVKRSIPLRRSSRSSSFSMSSFLEFPDKQKDGASGPSCCSANNKVSGDPHWIGKQASVVRNRRSLSSSSVMNQFFCLGAVPAGQAVKDPPAAARLMLNPFESYQRSVLSAA
ncbi:unnamed protein product [Cuscuta epithymum]|uniref:Uncharacterized protein n=1 Tax=Cuscuta epithymum TaxID=186058 RepID=A0AAV0D6J9_9ASTE|nr:unnamed protein product [Cuscuta epithymum]